MPSFRQQLWKAISQRWQENAARNGAASASVGIVRELWTFIVESTPERRKSRYGDMEYDWEHRVDTTSGSVGWRERLLGVFHSPYQPTEPALFREMMASLSIDLREFTFIDIGSGKGRTLLMASEYPFRKVVGVEILPELHKIADTNIRAYTNQRRCCAEIESICADARGFPFPEEALVLFLFNPLPEPGLRRVVENLERSLASHWRPVYVLYHNPLLGDVLRASTVLSRIIATGQYSLYATRDGTLRNESSVLDA